MSWFSVIEEDLLSHFQFSISALGCNLHLHSRKALLIAAMDACHCNQETRDMSINNQKKINKSLLHQRQLFSGAFYSRYAKDPDLSVSHMLVFLNILY